MSGATANPRVLANLYLSAILPCLTDLVDQDPGARDILGDMRASIVLRARGGPGATLHFAGGQVRWEEGVARGPGMVTLLFVSDRHLNAFFSGNKWALPLPVWGGWRVGVLARFSKLAERLEAILDGDSAVLATAAGRRLHARSSLIAAGLGLRALARGDDTARQALRAVPFGLASFSIEGDDRAVWFDHGSADYAAGWGVPPRLPDVRIVFADVEVAYGAMRDEIDTMAAVGCGRITVDGLVPLADGLNVVMERLRIYLRPPAK